MTMQRRRRLWTSVIETSGIQMLAASSPIVAANLLETFESDYGKATDVTIAAVLGQISFSASAEITSVSSSGNIGIGFSVVNRETAGLAAGNAAIPNPLTESQESAWWWRWVTPRLFSQASVQPASLQFPYTPASESQIGISIRSQRIVRAGNLPIMTIAVTGFSDVHEPMIRFFFRSLVLLP